MIPIQPTKYRFSDPCDETSYYNESKKMCIPYNTIRSFDEDDCDEDTEYFSYRTFGCRPLSDRSVDFEEEIESEHKNKYKRYVENVEHKKLKNKIKKQKQKQRKRIASSVSTIPQAPSIIFQEPSIIPQAPAIPQAPSIQVTQVEQMKPEGETRLHKTISEDLFKHIRNVGGSGELKSTGLKADEIEKLRSDCIKQNKIYNFDTKKCEDVKSDSLLDQSLIQKVKSRRPAFEETEEADEEWNEYY